MRQFATCLAVLVLLACAWLAFRSVYAHPAKGPSEAAPAVTESARRHVGATGTPVDPQGERVTVSAEFDGRTFRIECLDAADRSPLAGAPVWILRLASEALTYEQKLAIRRGDLDLAREFLQTLTTDAEGNALAPTEGGPAFLLAATAGRYGVATWDGEQESVVVLLEEDRHVLVRVRDFQGRPVPDARIDTRRYPSEASSRRGSPQGRTDEDGTLLVRHLQQLVDPDGSLELEFDCPLDGLPVERQVIDTSAPPAEVVLQLPPSGSLAIHLQEADGTPCDPRSLESDQVRLDHAPISRDRREGAYRLFASIGRDGTARFPLVALGEPFQLEVDGFESEDVEGPTRVGQTVDVILRQQPGSAFLTGRLLDADGVPAADTDLSVDCTSGPDAIRAAGKTDEAGRFRLWADSRLVGRTVTPVIKQADVFADPSATWQTPLDPRMLEVGDNDLGDVPMQRAVALVSGTAWVDGQPNSNGVVFRVERRHADSRWRQVASQDLERGDDGRFEIFASPAPGVPMRVVAGGPGLLPVEPIECEPGSTDLEFRLSSGGQVTATFLVDASVPLRSLGYQLLANGETIEPTNTVRDEQGRLRFHRISPNSKGLATQLWNGLHPGPHDLLVLAPGHREPLVRIDNLQVGAGPCEDPRLDAIDLRGLVHELHIRVHDAEDRLVRDPQAWLLAIDGAGDAQAYQLDEGVVTLHAGAPLHLLVDVPGHRVVELQGVTADQTIRVEAAPRIEARIAPVPTMLPEGVSLELRLSRQDVDRRNRIHYDTGRSSNLEGHWWLRLTPDERGASELFVRQPAVYGVSLVVERGGDVELIRGLEPTTWTARPDEAPEDLVFRIPDGALADALARLN